VTLSLSTGTVAIIGGPQVFALFPELGYDGCCLSRRSKCVCRDRRSLVAPPRKSTDGSVAFVERFRRSLD
jgi:hypothetical protein